MTRSPLAQPLDWTHDPRSVLRAWPRNWPLAVLWSDPDARSPHARWTILAAPTGALRTEWYDPHWMKHDALHQPSVKVRSAWVGPRGTLADSSWPRPRIPRSDDPLVAMQSAIDATALPGALRAPDDPDLPPFRAGWIGCLHYDIGRLIEPRTAVGFLSNGNHRFAIMLWQRCPAAYVFDHLHKRWWIVGDAQARRALPEIDAHAPPPLPAVSCGIGLLADSGTDYQRTVTRAIEYIRAGDVFQVNLAHGLQRSVQGSMRALFEIMIDRARPWYGAYLEDLSGARRDGYLSMSPELFFEYSPASRRIVTRPIKGTRPASPGAESELARSPKDAAELAMIVDLMRNDLGRVCDYGSVRVDDPRAFERHGGRNGVVHSVATVSGRVRPGVNLESILRATFPGGSITGAPKVRAMQIIEQSEGVSRGPYCGSIGYVSDSGNACFNIAIRTAHIVGGRPRAPLAASLDEVSWGALLYRVGAGIVADSDPQSEFDETLAKARFFTDIAGPGRAPGQRKLNLRALALAP